MRSTLDAAILAAVHAHRQNARKWQQLYDTFDNELGLDVGVAGKLLTEEKQLSNRLQKELIRENPHYIVLCSLEGVRLEMVREHLAGANLPAARCALLVTYDELRDAVVPVELQVYQRDVHVSALAAAYPELTPIGVDREETDSKGTPGASTGASGGHAKPITVVPMVIDDRIRRAIRLAVLTTSAVLLVGPPGTGKTALLRELLDELRADPGAFGFSADIDEPIWVTPEESWGTRELVGGETVAEDQQLRFREGHVLRAIRENRWLVLDEANRADMDRIFGGLLTWLSNQEVELGTASTAANAPTVMLGWTDAAVSETQHLDELEASDEEHGSEPIRYLAGRQWRLLGTYNALDAQRVFRFGHALGRRFVRVPVPPLTPDAFVVAANPLLVKLPADLRKRLPQLYVAHYAEEGTRLGPALFMRVPDYVEAGLLNANGEEDGEDVEAEELDETVAALEDPAEEEDAAEVAAPPAGYGVKLLAEAYLLNAGAFLARYEPDELDRLGERIVKNAALPATEWKWVQRMSQHLG